MNDRAMPYDYEAEVSVLTALLHDPEATTTLRADEFYAERHSLIYQAVQGLKSEGQGVTVLTVADRLKAEKRLADAGGIEYVSALLDGVPAGLDYHAAIVRDKAQLRRLIRACEETLLDAYEGGKATDVFAHAEARLLNVTETRQTADGFRPVSDAVHEAFEMVERAANAKGGVVGIRTGIPKLDMMSSGLERGGLTVLAARPAMGKSALGWQFAERASMDGEGVLIASYEMGAGQLGRRGLSRLAHIDSNRIRRGELTPDEWRALSEAGKRLADLPIWINDYPPHHVEQLRSQVHRHKTKHGIGLVVVDYLQQMSGPAKGNRNNEVEHLSRGLKRMARELDVHVLAPSNRTPTTCSCSGGRSTTSTTGRRTMRGRSG